MSTSKQSHPTPTPCPHCTVTHPTKPTFCNSTQCPGCHQTKLWLRWLNENEASICICRHCEAAPTNMAGLITERTICATALGRALTINEEMGVTLWLQNFSNDVRWMLRVQYLTVCKGKILTSVSETDEEGEWVMWVLDGAWLSMKIADGEYEEMVGYLPKEA